MLVRQSGVSVRIFRVKRKEVTSYLIAYYLRGRRCRETFRGDLKTTAKRAREIAHQIGAQMVGNGVLPAADVESHRAAVESLKPWGVSLVTAVQEYIAARQRIGDHPLAEAADFYARHASPDLPKRTLAAVAQEMLDAKKADGMTERYRAHLAYALAPACDVLTKPVSEITTAEIDDYLRSLTLSTRSRCNIRAALVTAFEFAKSRGYLPRDRETAAKSSARVKVRSGEVEIFTPKEMAALLTASNADTLPLIALGGFAGLRTAEIARLEWKDVNFEENIITVSAAKSKTASRRIVQMQPNLVQWLAPYSGHTGKLLPIKHANTCCKMEWAVAEAAGIKWKHNALRHSYGSYRLAQIKNAAEVALEMGNSPQMIFKHYRELVTPRDAAAWWAIAPKRADNVIPMQTKAAEG